MPNPVESDLHVNAPLTFLSIAYMQSAEDFIADKVFPVCPVDKKSDLYWKYSKSDWRRTDVLERAPGTESAGTGWKTTTDSYFCKVYAVHKDIDDQLRGNADENFNLDKTSTELVTTEHLLSRDVAWAAAYMVTGVWATEYEGGVDFTQFDDAASDPIQMMSILAINFRKLTTKAWNKCVMGPYVIAALKSHPDIIDRIKYTQRGIVTEDLIATLFDVDELYVTYASINDGPLIDDAVAQDAAADYEFIGDPNSVLFCYAPKAPSKLTPSAGYTFTWKSFAGSGGKGIRIKKFRMEHIESDRIEAQTSYEMKQVCSDMGLFLLNAVSGDYADLAFLAP